jgi:hypothetical protein
MLYNKGFLNIPEINQKKSNCKFESCIISQRLAACIVDSINANKKGVDGKRRVLSIVADNFSHEELNALKVNYNNSKKFIFYFFYFSHPFLDNRCIKYIK